MITRLTEHLYRVISDLNIVIEYGLHTDLKQHYRELTNSIKEFKETPEILYKELFEPWCKVDFYRFCRLINIIQNKDDEWQENSISLLPYFPVLFNELCQIYGEIEMRQPEMVKSMQTDTVEGLRLPDELNTDRARKYFARAVEAKFMKLTRTGAKWLKPLARLGYLCLKIYPQPRPITALEKYFGITNDLSAAITQASYEAKRGDVIKWRAEIDKNIFFD